MAQVGRALAVRAVGPLAQGLGKLPLLQGRAPLLPRGVRPFHLAADVCGVGGETAPRTPSPASPLSPATSLC